MFFALSKILGFLANPANFLLVLAILVLVLAVVGFRRWAWRIGLGAIVFVLVVAVVPAGEWVIRHLEQRFPFPVEMPQQVDGIVVLGGVINPWVSAATGRPAFGGNVERIWEGADLALAYPDAKLVFTGGSGRLLDQEVREADYVLPVFGRLGVDSGRVITERDSRNTAENAERAFALAAPKPGEIWILVTDAAHMPRSMGSFAKAGWPPLIAYPVDPSFPPGREIGFRFNLSSGLSWTGRALHESLGLLAYYVTGRTDRLYPSPE
ncbi:MAG: YdcF family protein [Magnetovibrionaceae bacterium]